MQLSNNTTLQGGKYQIVRFLSSGGFGNTYEGVHTMMETRVAIKEFFPKMFCNRDENTSHVSVATQGNRELVDKLRKKFNEEAKAVFQMKHDNIVRVLDIFEENGTAYYVMEYIDGKSLNDITKEHGALPEAEAVGYIRQVADALNYVHSLNRLHLDIKPGNIMIDKNGKAILIDFGASKHYDDESGENTSTLMGVNTKGYAPIEQSTQSFTSFSPATDIYALGATLYKLLTGIVPPDANLLLAEEEALQPLPNYISAPTRDAVMTAMSLRRKDRPQSAENFLIRLDDQHITKSKSKNSRVEFKGTTKNQRNEKSNNPSFLKGVSLLLCNSTQFFFWREGRIYQVEELKSSRDIELRLLHQNIDVISFSIDNISSCIIVYDDNQTSLLNLKRIDYIQHLPGQRLIEERTAVGMGYLYKNISFEGILTVSYQNKYTVMDCDTGVYEVIANDIPINKMEALLSDYSGRKNVEVFSAGYEHLKNVIKGALLQHQILNNQNHDNVVLLDVFPHSVDLLLMEKSMVRDYRNLLPKDSSIPVKRALLLPVSSQNELCLSINSEKFYIPYKINNRIDSIEIVLDITSNHDISIEIKDSCTKYSHKFSFLDIVNSEETQLL